MNPSIVSLYLSIVSTGFDDPSNFLFPKNNSVNKIRAIHGSNLGSLTNNSDFFIRFSIFV